MYESTVPLSRGPTLRTDFGCLYAPGVQVAFDEQIFALQKYGGISRMFVDLARQFLSEPSLGVNLLPLNAPVINRPVLDDDLTRTRMAVSDAHHEYYSLLRYLIRIRPRRGNDIVHNTFYLPHGLVRYPGAKRVVTVHDMIPERMPTTRRRLDFLTLKQRYVMSADHIICVSEATRDDMLDVYGTVSAPISVIHHGVDTRFAPHAPPLSEVPSNYVLFVGNRDQYKNGRELMQAFAAIASVDPDLSLLFVGGGPFTSEERDFLRGLGIADRTQQTSLSDEDMPSAYANATAFVFPSSFEGFGMPVLEAMASGCPTILAQATSLPEIGGEAAVYFSPGDVEELADKMTLVIKDRTLRENLRFKGLERASHFTWAHAAKQTAEAYRSTL